MTYFNLNSQICFFGGTSFGQIHSFLFESDLNQCNSLEISTLCFQKVGCLVWYLNLKGVICSIDFCYLKSEACFRLVSCAEDRSIAIWSQSSLNVTSPIYSVYQWNLLYFLKAGSIFDETIVFNSRIWRVRIGNWGFLAIGEVILRYCDAFLFSFFCS